MRVLISFSSRVILNISWLELSTNICRGCCWTTHGIAGIFFCWSPVCQSLFRSENLTFLVKILGCSLDTSSYTVVCVLVLRFVFPGKWPVCCIGSNVTSLCGVVRFATCLAGTVKSSRFSVNCVIVGVRIDCVTVDISSIIWVAFNLCVTVFIWVSSRSFKLLNSNSLSRCVTICSYKPFSKWAWFIDFFRCGGILAYMNCSMITWAATPNAYFANF